MARKKQAQPPSEDDPKSRSRARSRAKTPGSVAPSDLERARELTVQAAQTPDPKRAIALAKQAVATSPDCAEALLLLGHLARSRKGALAYYEQAVDAAARVLGPETFRTNEGMFWGILETRFYMRARLGLAELYWSSGRRQEAVEHLSDMLRLNPEDHQGVRYLLVLWLLTLDRDEELALLLEVFDEDSATWSYTKTLAEYRRNGDCPKSRKLLAAARKSNKHVPDYLLGRKPLPPDQPTFSTPGEANDAILYVGQHLGAWRSSPGALAWIRSKLKPPTRRLPKPVIDRGPSPPSQERLLSLPRELDDWQADFRQFTRRIKIAGELVRPWMVLVSSRTHDLVLAHGLTDEPPSAEELWEIFASAVEQPAAGEPHRPTRLQVGPQETWQSLVAHFESIGVACSRSEVLDQIDYLFENLSRFMAGSDPPGLLDMPGVTPEQVGRFYDAAAEFYTRSPWRSMGYEAVIRIECDSYQSGPWFAVIMGQSGLTLGLALYENLTLLRQLWAGRLTDDEGARRTVALSVTFDDDANMTEADLESIGKYGWKIAATDAYPSIFRKERGMSIRPPLGWEIDLMNACLRVLPDFVARRAPDDQTRELVPVPGSAEPRQLGLSWVEEKY